MSTKLVTKSELDSQRLKRKELRLRGEHNAPEIASLNARKAIESIGDSRMQQEVYTTVVKAVESYDLTGVRLDSMYDAMAELANAQTIFRDIIAANGIYQSTDFQIAWRETYANGSAEPEFFNLNNGLPAEAEMSRAVRRNTMGAYGNQLNIRWITEALDEQSPISTQDERATQLRMQLVKMKRFSNQHMLANTEVTSEIIGDIPQWGGFATRSTDNATVLAASSDLTSPLLQALVNQVTNPASVDALGMDIPLVMLVTNAQIAKVRDLMIARFPAENSTTFLDYQARLERMLPGVKLNPDMVMFYRANPGGMVACIYEPQLTAGLGLMFMPTLPKIAKFKLMGTFGSWSVSRPTPELTNLFCTFDFESIVDPLLASRGSYTNLN